MNILVRRKQIPIIVTLLAAVVHVTADVRPAAAQAAGRGPTTEELERRLEQRDAIIEDLRRRVEELERRSRGLPAAAEEAAPAPTPPAAAAPAQPAPTTAEAPGQFEVDEEAIERALETALVQEGALLLRPGTAEIRPSLTYARQEDETPVFLNQGGQQFVATNERERDILEAGLSFRLGLPFESQLELEVPYRYEETSTIASIGFAGALEETEDGAGFGDLRIGFLKGLLRERGWRPDLIAGLQWDTDTGESDGDVELGTGFDEIEATLTAVKRFDPLVFVGGLSYRTAFEEDGVDPGDEFGFAVGTVLAASPESSLRFFLNQTFGDHTERDGVEVPGSDSVISSFEVGVSTIVARRMLLDISAEIGLTDDAADYVFKISLPIRFDLPGIGS